MKKVKLIAEFIIEQNKYEPIEEFDDMIDEFKNGSIEASNGVNLGEFFDFAKVEILNE